MEAASLLDELAGSQRIHSPTGLLPRRGHVNHYLPSVVDHILRRGEFYTPTPLPAGNLARHAASHLRVPIADDRVDRHDSPTPRTMTAQPPPRRPSTWPSPTPRETPQSGAFARVHPQYRETIRTYAQGMEINLAGDDSADLQAAPEALLRWSTRILPWLSSNTRLLRARVRLHRLIESVHAQGAMVCVVANPQR